METTPTQHEFFGPDWIVALRAIIERLLDGKDLDGVDFTISEEVTDPPPGRSTTEAGTLGWYLRIRDGQIEVGDQPLPDADARLIADYRTHQNLARRTWAAGPASRIESQVLIQVATEEGLLRLEGDLSKAPPVVRQLVGQLHDPVAAITA